MLSPEQQQRAIATLLKRKENSVCADCNGKSPCWASLDFGVFICMNCAGAHRALGPSITRVKSTKLDTWHGEWVQLMRVGNAVLNEYWQKRLVGPYQYRKPNINTSLEDIITYVQNKYVHKKYVDPQMKLQQLIKRSQVQVVSNHSNNVQRSQSVQNPTKQIQTKVIPKPENQIKNGSQSPFSAFDSIINNKLKQQKKSTNDNLISFDFQVTKQVKEKPSQKPVQKYNHSHFHSTSIGGNKPNHKQKVENDKFINFDNVIKQKINNLQSKAHKNYYPNSYIGNSSKNINNQPYHFAKIHLPPNTPSQLNTISAKTFQHFDAYLLSPTFTHKPKTSNSTTISSIALQPSVSSKQAPKSWIDEWK